MAETRLREAAAIVEVKGWTTNALAVFGRVCALGAINTAWNGQPTVISELSREDEAALAEVMIEQFDLSKWAPYKGIDRTIITRSNDCKLYVKSGEHLARLMEKAAVRREELVV